MRHCLQCHHKAQRNQPGRGLYSTTVARATQTSSLSAYRAHSIAACHRHCHHPLPDSIWRWRMRQRVTLLPPPRRTTLAPSVLHTRRISVVACLRARSESTQRSRKSSAHRHQCASCPSQREHSSASSAARHREDAAGAIVNPPPRRRGRLWTAAVASALHWLATMWWTGMCDPVPLLRRAPRNHVLSWTRTTTTMTMVPRFTLSQSQVSYPARTLQ